MPEKFRVHVITLSDRAHRGGYADLSGPAVVKYVKYAMAAAGWNCEIRTSILPDEAVALRASLAEAPAAD